MPVTEQDLLTQVALGEDSSRQFKADIHNAESLAAEMAAFANTEGGVIYLGVADDGSLPGLSAADVARLNQLVSNAASQLIRSPLTVHTENVLLSNGNLVIVLTVPKGIDKPYFDKNGVIWLKTGSDKRRVNSKEELRRIFQISSQFHADELPTKAGIDKLDKLLFRDFLRQKYEQDFPDSPDDLIRLLQNLNLAAESGVLNLAGVLLFAERPEWIVPQFVVKAIRYPGTEIHISAYEDTEDFAGPMPRLFKDAFAFIMRNLHKIQAGHGVNAPGTPEIPEAVFEELLVNALVHRDYLVSAPIRIFIYDDRIEIISPGHLPDNLTVEKIKAGNSNIRNPILVSYVAKGLLPYHGLGSGIKRALRGWPDIDFVDDHDGCLFTVTVHRKPADRRELEQGSPESSPEDGLRAEFLPKSSLEDSPEESFWEESLPKSSSEREFQGESSSENSSEEGPQGERFPEGSPEKQRTLLNLVRANPQITTEAIGQALGISKRAVLKRIAIFKKQGLIRRVGPNKGGKWEVLRGAGR